MSAQIVIGIDGGGSYTRAAAADLNGHVRSRILCRGASPQHNERGSARENVRRAILGAATQAGCRIEHVRCVVAGLAGLDEPSDEAWAEEFTRVPGLECPRHHVNDAVVAHEGALLGEPGIVVISGTGSIILAVTEDGDRIRNYDLHHYARSAARHVAVDALLDIVGGDHGPEDRDLIEDTLSFWEAADEACLRKLARRGFGLQGNVATEAFGRFAPIVTGHAMRGSPAAQRSCNRAAEAICQGVRLLGVYFTCNPVSVCLIGGSAMSTYIAGAVGTKLEAAPGRIYRIVDAALPPDLGAVLMALRLIGQECDQSVFQTLRDTWCRQVAEDSAGS